MVRSQRQGGRWQHRADGRHSGQPAGVSPEPLSEARLGLPDRPVVVLFCLATGSALEMAIGQYSGKQTGENALFRSLWDELEPEDVVLGDRYYYSYFDLAMLKQRGVDGVFRLHQRRPCDFRRGRRSGKEDQIVTWFHPGARTGWMRIHTIKYLRRWRFVRCGFTWGSRASAPRCWLGHDPLGSGGVHEIGSRFLVSTTVACGAGSAVDQDAPGMDMLRCKTPEMVRKEIWMTLLGYNVIRR